MLAALGLPDSLHGQRVLEIGPADGYFTKQLTLRGARVTAYDYAAKDFYGFAVMEALHGAPFDFVHGTIYDIGQFAFEPFDLVLCLGVLYHLPDMVRAMHLLRGVCRNRLIVETVVAVDLGDGPLARYHPGASFNKDYTNFWSPNMACVEAILADVGFVVERSRLLSKGTLTADTGRAMFDCRLNAAAGATKKTSVAYSQISV
jgi:tRNA (mo5U34)-methyltransferase